MAFQKKINITLNECKNKNNENIKLSEYVLGETIQEKKVLSIIDKIKEKCSGYQPTTKYTLNIKTSDGKTIVLIINNNKIYCNIKELSLSSINWIVDNMIYYCQAQHYIIQQQHKDQYKNIKEFKNICKEKIIKSSSFVSHNNNYYSYYLEQKVFPDNSKIDIYYLYNIDENINIIIYVVHGAKVKIYTIKESENSFIHSNTILNGYVYHGYNAKDKVALLLKNN